ncbi:hypothetical protein [Streptomyces spongiae]|uniref:FtsH ternary system domain-containing protein n=1 Tax=Streptomyces spongiae TaxID=565072 RepID=A0A5N8XFY4_9ACTN|nr:hypothetical protein [Streptomyces spongiae]MPY58420.1 hypothetical protein [Streptomyces spongiae]
MARRRRGSTPRFPEQRPPIGGIQPVEDGEPAAPPVPLRAVEVPRSRRRRPAPPVRVAGRFRTASAALTLAGQMPLTDSGGGAGCFRGPEQHDWWVVVELSLEAVREMTSASGGRVYVEADGAFVRDRGWGRAPAADNLPGQAVPLSALVAVTPLDLMRAAGLRTVAPAPLREAVLLMPGPRVSAVIRRALDIGLTTRYRTVGLAPLFRSPENGVRSPGNGERPGDGPSPDQETIVTHEVRLTAADESPVPASLVAALERDPYTLVCRRGGEFLLVQHRRSAPLADRRLEELAGGDVWLLADSVHGCARVRPLGDFCDGAALVTLSEDHALTNATQDPTGGREAALPPEPTPLTLVRDRTPHAAVDAVLLDTGDRDLLPALLAGRPLADSALLTAGRDRHLLTAPGGVLEQLPVGDPLYCLGPGNLFLPLGHRTQPLLPPTARTRLFPADPGTAVVLLADRTLVFDLTRRRPVWDLWAGPLPEVDVQLPGEAEDGLAAVADLVTPPPARPSPERRRVLDGVLRRDRSLPRTWRDEAYDAELAGELEHAADIHLRHRNPREAARLLERAAQQRG